MQMQHLSEEQIRRVKGVSLAEKYGVSPSYVRKILTGARESNSPKAKAILADAKKIIEITEKKEV